MGETIAVLASGTATSMPPTQVRRGRGGQHRGALERDRRVQRAEQRRAGAEQDSDHVHADLVDQDRLDVEPVLVESEAGSS